MRLAASARKPIACRLKSSGSMKRLTRELLGSGLSMRDAAVILGISHQRVSQLVRPESERVAGTR